MKYLAITIIALTFAFSSFGQCAPESQKQAFQAKTPYERAAAWRTKLKNVLETDATLTAAQRDIVYDVLFLVHADRYDEVADTITGSDIPHRIGDSFPRQKAFDIFFSLEDDNLFVDDEIYRIEDMTKCTCNLDFNVLCESCRSNWCTEPSSFGCGPAWLLPCNGFCYRPS